jgi:hypothetical protein
MMFALCVIIAISEPSDVVAVNGTILTVDDGRPVAEAMAIRGGRFVQVGANEAVRKSIGPKTTIIDLAGRVVVPGFVDAHAHPRAIYPDDSPFATVDAGPDLCKTIDDLVAAIRTLAKKRPAGTPITGRGYQDTKLGRHPTRQDLDRATTDHPVVIVHSSGHLSVCNSLALSMANVTKATKDPMGGSFERDAAGEPTGLLKERAAGIVRGALPSRDVPPEVERVGYRECYRQFLAQGITSVHVAGIDESGAKRLASARTDALPIRLYVMLRDSQIERAVALKSEMKRDESDVRFGAIKSFYGNSLSGRTAWLYEPYAEPADSRGIPPGKSKADLDRLIRNVHRAGLQACIHSNGDREIDQLLEAFESVLEASPRADHRHRIEHCSVVNPAILRRIRKLNLVVAPHSYVYEHGDKIEAFGARRWDWMLPNRSLIDQGTVVAGNSDYPVSAAIPMLRIHDMVNRISSEGKLYGASQRCTVEQALRAFTMGGAFAEFAERFKGSIEVGKVADFVVLDRDPRRVPAANIKDVAVVQTVVGGVTVFEKK